MVDLFRAVIAEQVEHHVVGGGELALHRHLFAGGRLVDGAYVDVRFFEDDPMPDGVDAAPSRPTHQLGQLARAQWREVFPIELGEGGDDAGARRHVDAERQCLGREDDLDQSALEELFDEFLEVGEEPGVMHGQPTTQGPAVEEIAIELGFIGILDLIQAGLHHLVDDGFLRVAGQIEAVRRAAGQRLAAAAPRKNEIDRGKKLSMSEAIDDRQQVVFGRPPKLGQSPVGRILALRPLSGLSWNRPLLIEQRVELISHGEPESQLDRSLGHADGGDVAPLLTHPARHFLEVADGGREPDEFDVARGLDDDFLPNRTPREIIDVVDLVEDHVVDPLQSLRILVDKVAQDLGGHHDHRRRRIDRVLPGHQPDVSLTMESAVVPKFLVGQRLEWGGVDGAGVRFERAVDGIVGDHRLARAGGGRDQHPLMGLELFDGLDLERIERPGKGGLKGIDQRLRRDATGLAQLVGRGNPGQRLKPTIQLGNLVGGE